MDTDSSDQFFWHFSLSPSVVVPIGEKSCTVLASRKDEKDIQKGETHPALFKHLICSSLESC